MRIAPNIYLVASGVQGCSLTNDLDCNCWLFDAEDVYLLFDTGAGVDVPSILREMQDDGLNPEKLAYAFLTHGHADHSGGAFEIKRLLGCTLLCSELTAGLLLKGEEGISLAAARSAGVYPHHYRYRQPIPDVAFERGASFDLGNATVTSLPTPGHSLDHTSFVIEQNGFRALVTGDALLHSGRMIYQKTYDFDVGRSCDSILSLSQVAFDALLPGHGLFARTGGHRHVDAAAALIDQMRTPLAVDFTQI
ncbi:MBL fold metallo-hydrolase [Mesorhizobium sp. VK23B]|uniref:MBL fold metallo-hydrolase n=1 Tax=Mesorhizobium dulcispinae TaxID=3072316 RepID=A0ABU4XAI4_9HYPH|nr:MULTISPECIES: MBL fold metallo-hydrolase [unclassified Mesorhizobium]MDX8465685.1 MBL fold metallo-hydrolase [Mesorhizobium sp. VK23B]MDX8471513.1 MBL fold metallo-hydrolase [Mesorhizobium sp. VK23A]